MTEVKWNENHQKIFDRIGLSFDPNLPFSDTDFAELEDLVTDFLQMHCIGVNGDITPTGMICEDIMDILAEQ